MTAGSSPRPTPPPEPEELFRCETTRQDESAHILAIGELDLDTTPILREEIDALHSAGVRHLTLDLSGLDFIDSTGLRLTLDCDVEARRNGITFALIPGPPAVQRIFELTDTRAHLPFVDP